MKIKKIVNLFGTTFYNLLQHNRNLERFAMITREFVGDYLKYTQGYTGM